MCHADPFKSLESSLAITPSADFAARVRTRISEAPERAPGTHWLPWLSAAALVVLGVGAAVMWRVEPVTVARPAPITSVAPAVPTIVGPAATSDAVVLPAVEEARAAQVAAPRPIVTDSVKTNPVTDAVFTEVLVPPDQRIALMHLLRGIREGRTSVPSRAAAETEFDADGNVVPRAL